MYKSYVDIVNNQINNHPMDWNFKSIKVYNRICGHLNERIGKDYYRVLRDKYKGINIGIKDFLQKNKDYLIELSKINDFYGKPLLYEFNGFCKCNGVNFRYILHSILILKFIKKLKLNQVNIIEIGGGLGGLCFYLNKLSNLFDIKINTYVIFDLLEISNLQNKYLDLLNIKNVKFYQLNNFKKLENNSFLISNYAFSEIEKDIQNIYIKEIINPYIDFGFITWNFNKFYKFLDNCEYDIEKEYPLTGKDNYYIRFNKKK